MQTTTKSPPASGALPAGRSKSQRDFFRIASVSTALAFGVVVGSVASLRKDGSAFSFQFSGAAVVGFLVGATIGLLYWRVVSLSAARGTSRLLRVTSFLLFLGAVAMFLFPLRFLSMEKLAEVWQGLAAAAIALSLLGLILWRIKKFLDHDSTRV